jgi:hypothetical protein
MTGSVQAPRFAPPKALEIGLKVLEIGDSHGFARAICCSGLYARPAQWQA